MVTKSKQQDSKRQFLECIGCSTQKSSFIVRGKTKFRREREEESAWSIFHVKILSHVLVQTYKKI